MNTNVADYITKKSTETFNLLRSIFVMLIPRPPLRHPLHQPRDEKSFPKLPRGVDSPPRSISDDLHDDESSILGLRRFRRKHPQFRNISFIYFNFFFS